MIRVAQYEKNMKELLEDPLYKKLKKDLTSATESKFQRMSGNNLVMRVKPSAGKPPSCRDYPRYTKCKSLFVR